MKLVALFGPGSSAGGGGCNGSHLGFKGSIRSSIGEGLIPTSLALAALASLAALAALAARDKTLQEEHVSPEGIT